MAPRGQRNTSSTAEDTLGGSNLPVEQQTGQGTGGATLQEKLEAAQRRIMELEEERRRREELAALEEQIRQL